MITDSDFSYMCKQFLDYQRPQLYIFSSDHNSLKHYSLGLCSHRWNQSITERQGALNFTNTTLIHFVNFYLSCVIPKRIHKPWSLQVPSVQKSPLSYKWVYLFKFGPKRLLMSEISFNPCLSLYPLVFYLLVISPVEFSTVWTLHLPSQLSRKEPDSNYFRLSGHTISAVTYLLQLCNRASGTWRQS